MTSIHAHAGPNRRRVLAGAGAALAAPAVLAVPAPTSAAPAPECLASLVQEGELTYRDLMAG